MIEELRRNCADNNVTFFDTNTGDRVLSTSWVLNRVSRSPEPPLPAGIHTLRRTVLSVPLLLVLALVRFVTCLHSDHCLERA